MLDVVDGVTSQTVHVVVIPNMCVQFHEALGADLAVHEEVLVLVLLQVTLVDVYRQNDCAGRDHGGAVFQELGIVALKFADLKRHVVDGLI